MGGSLGRSVGEAILALHRRLLPATPRIGWIPYLWLFWLIGFFAKWFFVATDPVELTLALLTLPVFLALYFNGALPRSAVRAFTHRSADRCVVCGSRRARHRRRAWDVRPDRNRMVATDADSNFLRCTLRALDSHGAPYEGVMGEKRKQNSARWTPGTLCPGDGVVTAAAQ